jgi:Ulp1 family protease
MCARATIYRFVCVICAPPCFVHFRSSQRTRGVYPMWLTLYGTYALTTHSHYLFCCMFAGKDIFNLNKIFFPINQGNQHWTLAVAFMPQRRIQYYDSLGGSGSHYLRDLLRYLDDEHKDKKKCPLVVTDGNDGDVNENNNNTTVVGDWTLVPCTADTPRQYNGYDCGVFACVFADFLSNCDDIMEDDDDDGTSPLSGLGQEHISHCRERIALAILTGQAM